MNRTSPNQARCYELTVMDAQESSTSREVSRLFRGSSLSALFGWLSAHVLWYAWGVLRGHAPETANDWFGMLVFPLFSLPFVLVIWFFVLVPLYCRVPLRSILWRWPVCTACGAAAGATIAHPFGQIIGTALGALIGGATCLFGSLTRHYFHRPNDNTRNT